MHEPPESLNVPLDGGHLAIERSGDPQGPTVLLVHGITSSVRAWDRLCDAMDDAGDQLDRVAVDLRGRGGSAGLPGPSSMGQHADDLMAVLDHLGVDTAVIAGHSMGGFVACATADRHPDRIPAVVLVDGGPPLNDGGPVPEDQVEAVLLQVIGPSLERLDMRFDTPQAYRDFWAAHPSLAAVDAAWRDAYADHDLVPAAEGGYRSCVNRDRVIEDGRDLLTKTDLASAFTRLPAGSVMLRAERGMLDGPDGLYTASRLAQVRAAAPALPVVEVTDVNHYTILIQPPGVAAVCEAIRGTAPVRAS